MSNVERPDSRPSQMRDGKKFTIPSPLSPPPEERSYAALASTTDNSLIRARIWTDLINWDNRRAEQDGFLGPVLRGRGSQTVLDAAMGDGIDAVYLIQNRFKVTPNEYDDAFRAKAVENAREFGIELNPLGLDWRALSSEFGTNAFDAVVCIGNSIVCLPDKNEIPNAIQNFYDVLHPNGVLIIDERNYQKVLDNREAALAGTLPPSGKYLYTGTDKVKARFVEIADERVVHEYTQLATGDKAYFQVYPMKGGELEGMLQGAGFSQIIKFSDYQPQDNPNADFFQYVCIK